MVVKRRAGRHKFRQNCAHHVYSAPKRVFGGGGASHRYRRLRSCLVGSFREDSPFVRRKNKNIESVSPRRRKKLATFLSAGNVHVWFFSGVSKAFLRRFRRHKTMAAICLGARGIPRSECFFWGSCLGVLFAVFVTHFWGIFRWTPCMSPQNGLV